MEKVYLYLPSPIITKKAGANMPEENVKNNYDRINVTFPKGQKEIIMQAAEASGESVNGYIKKAVDERMKRENIK